MGAPGSDLRLDEIRRLVDACDAPGFFFLDIGASDGITNDPIFPFIEERGWRGLAVEPDPDVFERLRANVAHLPGVRLERAAITTRPAPLHRIGRGPFARGHWMDQLASLDRARLGDVIGLIRHHRVFEDIPDDLERWIEPLDVPCLTFAELVARHGIERIDYLNIDIEGGDVELLEAIDLDRFRNRLLCIEMDPAGDARAAAAQARLERQGYTAHPGLMLFSVFFARA